MSARVRLAILVSGRQLLAVADDYLLSSTPQNTRLDRYSNLYIHAYSPRSTLCCCSSILQESYKVIWLELWIIAGQINTLAQWSSDQRLWSVIMWSYGNSNFGPLSAHDQFFSCLNVIQPFLNSVKEMLRSFELPWELVKSVWEAVKNLYACAQAAWGSRIFVLKTD